MAADDKTLTRAEVLAARGYRTPPEARPAATHNANGRRACTVCGAPLPPDAHPLAEVCGRACRTERERLRRRKQNAAGAPKPAGAEPESPDDSPEVERIAAELADAAAARARTILGLPPRTA